VKKFHGKRLKKGGRKGEGFGSFFELLLASLQVFQPRSEK